MLILLCQVSVVFFLDRVVKQVSGLLSSLKLSRSVLGYPSNFQLFADLLKFVEVIFFGGYLRAGLIQLNV